MSSPTVLFIGLGNMGWGMAKNIVAKANLDKPLLVYNRTKERAAAFSQAVPAGKASVVDSIAESTAQSDVIFTMLTVDKVVEDVVGEALGSSPTSAAGKLFIDCSTVHPDTSARLSKTIEAHGGSFVAAPVFGVPAMADAGKLIGVLNGPAAAVDRARPFFEGVTSRAEILMKDEPIGNSSLLKLIGNTFVMNMVEQIAEGHVLAETAGLNNEHLHKWIGLMFPGPHYAYSERMLSGQYYTLDRPLFGVDLARKDLGHALNIAKKTGAKLHNAETADKHLVQVKEHDGEKGDVAAIYGAARQEAGLPYENQK